MGTRSSAKACAALMMAAGRLTGPTADDGGNAVSECHTGVMARMKPVVASMMSGRASVMPNQRCSLHSALRMLRYSSAQERTRLW